MKSTITRFALGAAALGLAAHFSVLSAQEGPRPRGERPDMFKMADANEDGKLSLDEMVDARVKMMANRAQRGPQREGGPSADEMKERMMGRMKEAFGKADADEDGFLTREEFGQMAHGGRGGQRGGGEGRKREKSQDS